MIGSIVRTTDLGEPGVFRPDSGIVQSGGDGMGGLGLAVLVLEYEGSHAMQHADFPSRDRRGMASALDALAAGLEAVQRHVGVGNEIGEDAQRIGTTANASCHRIGQSAVTIQQLGPGLGADHPLKLAHQHREGMWTGDRADQVMGVVDGSDPIPQRVVHRVFQGLGAGLDSNHLSPEQPHSSDIERLPLGVDLAHVNRAIESEQRRSGRGRNSVLAGAGLGDDTGLSHPAGQQCLAQHIVDLVRAGVVQILALQHDRRKLSGGGPRRVLAESSGLADGARPPGVVGQQLVELGLESRDQP